jgi:hypothetical protein
MAALVAGFPVRVGRSLVCFCGPIMRFLSMLLRRRWIIFSMRVGGIAM